jgi:O-antigen ligase
VRSGALRAGAPEAVPAAQRNADSIREEPAETGAGKIGAYCLFFLMFCSFSRVTDFVGAQLHIPFVASVLCFTAALASQNLLASFRSPVGKALTGFSLCLIASLPFSVWRGGSLNVITDTWAKSFALFVVTAALLPTLRQNARALKVLAYAFLLTSFLGFIFGRSEEGRFGLTLGLYQGSNELATAMAQGCIFWWYMINNPAHSFPKRVLSAVPLVPLMYILLNTASRAGLIVLVVVAVMIFIHYSMPGRVVLILIALIGIGGVIVFVPGSAKERLATIFASSDTSNVADNEALASKAQRAYLLRRSIELTLQHPALGVGPGQFAVAESGMSQAEGVRAQWLGTHNTYTQVSSEDGLPALLCFVASLFFCWRELSAAEKIHKRIRSPHTANYLAAAFALRLALVSYVVFFCFEHIAYDPFYPALAGIIVAFAGASRAMAANPDAGRESNPVSPAVVIRARRPGQASHGALLRP